MLDDVPRARTEPSPANTKMKVDRNSAKAALMVLDCDSSSGPLTAYTRGILLLSFFLLIPLRF